MSIACIPLLIIFGSFRFVFDKTIHYNDSNIIEVQRKTNYSFPLHLKLSTQINNDYKITKAKITDMNERILFENNLNSDSRWSDELSFKIKGGLLIAIFAEVDFLTTT